MKTIYLPLLCGVLTIAPQVQFPEGHNPPHLVVLKSSWSKQRIGWERDPFGGPLENFDEMRARTRNEKRIDDAKRGGSTDVDRIKLEARADAAIVQKVRQKGPPRYKFLYKATFKNTSDKMIKVIDWDYVFFDSVSQNEVGRQQFTSEEKITPGKSKEFSIMTDKPPAKTISVYALEKNEGKGLRGQVVLMRIEYADGSVWERQ